ncbi:MAG: T9SS type A sorting domain-containing protein [Candidatus Cloacimonetes bacterium]|nr:T9SS type A sorting domain-containing protein [Candidatus Cloacimonadota bacterium]
MKRVALIFSAVVLFSFLFADWDGTHKMHYPQLPDPTGYDVNCTYPYILADDWVCSEDGPVSDIHFWISFAGDSLGVPGYDIEAMGVLQMIHVSIHNNQYFIDPPFSAPFELLWDREFYPGEIQGQVTIAGPYTGDQGWFDPMPGGVPVIIENNHLYYYLVNINFIPDPFYQFVENIYWLDISIMINVQNPWGFELVGWKTSLTGEIYPFMDDAVVWWEGFGWYPLPWCDYYNELRPPYFQNMDLAFVITGEEEQPSPVELSSFSAVYSDGSPTLFWTTQSESNNQGWNVYRNQNNSFETSAQINQEMIPGAGTTSNPTDYAYEDVDDVVVNNTYWYWLENVTFANETTVHGPISLVIPEDGYNPIPPDVLKNARLYNTPNPFNPGTTIMFEIDTNEPVAGNICIYDIKGNLVRDLYTGTIPEAGINWDSLDNNGRKVPSGVYLYVLETPGRTYAKKMVLTK